jgi:hypothetical protein
MKKAMSDFSDPDNTFRLAFIYREALDMIVEDIDAWLAGESDEPSLEFIKAIRAHAEKTILEQ